RQEPQVRLGAGQHQAGAGSGFQRRGEAVVAHGFPCYLLIEVAGFGPLANPQCPTDSPWKGAAQPNPSSAPRLTVVMRSAASALMMAFAAAVPFGWSGQQRDHDHPRQHTRTR